MWKRGCFIEGFWHRFGVVQALPAKQEGVSRVWVQAVSLGKLLAIGPLLEALKRDGRTEVYLTTTTNMGYRLAGKKYYGLTDEDLLLPV